MIHNYHKYNEQQQAINDICARLQLVPYRPNYHHKSNDPNTVLIYTKAAAEYNTQLEDQYRSLFGGMGGAHGYPRNEDYAPFVCSIVNTDQNGKIDYDFANRGKVDLRGLKRDWTQRLESYIAEQAAANRNDTHV